MSQKKVMVVGSGGREHALVSTLARAASAPKVYCAPGNVGMEDEATLVPIWPLGRITRSPT